MHWIKKSSRQKFKNLPALSILVEISMVLPKPSKKNCYIINFLKKSIIATVLVIKDYRSSNDPFRNSSFYARISGCQNTDDSRIRVEYIKTELRADI